MSMGLVSVGKIHVGMSVRESTLQNSIGWHSPGANEPGLGSIWTRTFTGLPLTGVMIPVKAMGAPSGTGFGLAKSDVEMTGIAADALGTIPANMASIGIAITRR